MATEKFDQPWYPGEAIITSEFEGHSGKTTLQQTLLYETTEARDGILNVGIETGMAMSYERLAGLVSKTN